MVVLRDDGGHLQDRILRALQHEGPDLGVRPHGGQLRWIERSRLEQDHLVDADLSDVVETRGVFDTRAVIGLETDLACEHAGEMSDAKAVLPRLVVEELGRQSPVLRRVVGDAANLLQDRVGPQLREVVMDRSELLVLLDPRLDGVRTVDGVGRLTLG